MENVLKEFLELVQIDSDSLGERAMADTLAEKLAGFVVVDELVGQYKTIGQKAGYHRNQKRCPEFLKKRSSHTDYSFQHQRFFENLLHERFSFSFFHYYIKNSALRQWKSGCPKKLPVLY